MLPPAPDKPVGYALILTKEICAGKAEREIFSTGSKFFYPLLGRKYVLREGHRIDAFDYSSQQEDSRPKWMAQVLKTIQQEVPKTLLLKNLKQKWSHELLLVKTPKKIKQTKQHALQKQVTRINKITVV